jgi:hypothetical protein
MLTNAFFVFPASTELGLVAISRTLDISAMFVKPVYKREHESHEKSSHQDLVYMLTLQGSRHTHLH